MQIAENGWGELDAKEKSFCSKNSIKPEEYTALKKHIIYEQTKNKAITEALLAEKGKEFKGLRDKMPLLMDYWVKSRLIHTT